jgi:hypothetical protein
MTLMGSLGSQLPGDNRQTAIFYLGMQFNY